MIEPSTRNETVAVTTSSSRVCESIIGGLQRQQVLFHNQSTTETITLVKSNTQSAISLAGIVLLPNGDYSESNDSGFRCWQGSWQAVGTGAANLSVVEDLVPRG